MVTATYVFTTKSDLQLAIESDPNTHVSTYGGVMNTWDVSGITDMNGLFEDRTDFNEEIGSWDVSSVIDMKNMFRRASSFNQNIDSWNTAKVTTMQAMFEKASNFNQPLNSWDTSSVTEMDFMFYQASSFNQPLNSWVVTSVITMQAMFRQTSFNQDIDSWNTVSVTNMRAMFESASTFNQPLNAWDISSVTSMAYMFYEASSFNQPLNSWDVSSVTTFKQMFKNMCGDTAKDSTSTWTINESADIEDMKKLDISCPTSTPGPTVSPTTPTTAPTTSPTTSPTTAPTMTFQDIGLVKWIKKPDSLLPMGGEEISVEILIRNMNYTIYEKDLYILNKVYYNTAVTNVTYYYPNYNDDDSSMYDDDDSDDSDSSSYSWYNDDDSLYSDDSSSSSSWNTSRSTNRRQLTVVSPQLFIKPSTSQSDSPQSFENWNNYYAYTLNFTSPKGCGHGYGLGINISFMDHHFNVIIDDNWFNYTTPEFSSINYTFASTDGSTNMTVHGNFFGDFSGSGNSKEIDFCVPEFTMDSSVINIAKISNTMIFVENVLPGTGTGHSIEICILDTCTNEIYNYDSPSIKAIIIPTGNRYSPLTGGGDIISIYGENFGANVNEINVILSWNNINISCIVSEVIRNHEEISCELSPGVGKNLPLTIIVNGQESVSESFSYGKPVILAAVPESLSPDGGKLFLVGHNLGGSLFLESSVVLIGNFTCNNIEINVENELISCEYDEQEGKTTSALVNLPLILSVGDQKNDDNFEISFTKVDYSRTLEAEAKIITEGDVLIDEDIDRVAVDLKNKLEIEDDDLFLFVSSEREAENTFILKFHIGADSEDDALDWQEILLGGSNEENEDDEDSSESTTNGNDSYLLYAVNILTSIYCPKGKEAVDIETTAGNKVCSPCSVGYFKPEITLDSCTACPEGVDCNELGTIDPTILAGFWRSNIAIVDSAPDYYFESYEVYECKDVTLCLGGANSTCLPGHDPNSPLCMVCQDTYYPYANKCHSCEGDKSSDDKVIVQIYIMFLIICFLILWKLIKYERKSSVDNDKRDPTLKDLSSSKLETDNEGKQLEKIGKIRHLTLVALKAISDTTLAIPENGNVSSGHQNSTDIAMRIGQNAKSNAKILKTKNSSSSSSSKFNIGPVKTILVGGTQIIVSLWSLYDIPWPYSVRRIFSMLEIFNLNVYTLPYINLNCVSTVSFYTKFYLNIYTPPCIVLILLFIISMKLLIVYCKEYKKIGKNEIIDILQQMKVSSVKVLLWLVLLFYPVVSRIVFQSLHCITIDQDSYLYTDFNIKCNSIEYQEQLPIFITAVLIYPLGVILTTTYFLYSKKAHPLYAKSIRFIHEPFHPKFWWFECYDLVRRLLLTSVIVFFSTNEFLKIGIAIIICAFSLAFFMLILPFKDPIHNYMMSMSLILIFFTLCVGEFIFHTSSVSTDNDSSNNNNNNNNNIDNVSTSIIIVNVIFITFLICILLHNTFKNYYLLLKKQKWNNIKRKLMLMCAIQSNKSSLSKNSKNQNAKSKHFSRKKKKVKVQIISTPLVEDILEEEEDKLSKTTTVTTIENEKDNLNLQQEKEKEKKIEKETTISEEEGIINSILIKRQYSHIYK